jgi:3-phenylpropionate/trans-cinnamate dioxygenase ferredoxin reductase component
LTNVAIVGASAAGVSGAIALRRCGFDGSITLYDEDPTLPYERPPLSKSLSEPSRELKPIIAAEVYDELGVELRLGCRVVGLTSDRSVVLSDGSSTRHDRLLLTTGVSARTLAVSGAGLDHILHLRSAADARAVTSRLMLGGPLVVVGGGSIGLELAAVARGLGLSVTIVEVAPLPLAHAVGHDVAALISALHVDRGVRIATNATVASFRGTKEVEEVALADGRVLPARTVVVGVGVTANDGLARDHGVDCADGVIVDQFGGTSDPWLWAAGDVTVRRHRRLRRTCRIEHWDTAQRHGATVARSMVGDAVEETAVPYVWSDQYEHTFQAFGRPEPHDRPILRAGAEPDRFLAFHVDGGRVHAVAGIGYPRDVRAGKALIERAVNVSDDTLRDPDTDLKRLISTASTPGCAEQAVT